MISNVTTILSIEHLNPNATSDLLGPVNLENSIKCAITGQAYFRENASENVRIVILSSPDDGNYDTEAYAQFDVPVAGNQTVRTTYAVLPDPKYIKARAINLDPNITADSIEVIVTYTEP